MSFPDRPLRAAWLLPVLVLVAACTGSPGDSAEQSDGPSPSTSASQSPTTPDPTATTAAPSTPPAEPVQTPVPGADPTAAPADPRQQATLVVTSLVWNGTSGAVEASGYASVVESDGVCTLTLTKSSLTATARSTAYADASTTSCDLLTIPRSELGSGTWNATVDYGSSASLATSAPLTIEVP